MRVIATSDLGETKGIRYSADHLRRLVKQGKFPKPIKLGPGRNAFLEDEIDRWLQARADARDAA
jgi:prophage regulatory protein